MLSGAKAALSTQVKDQECTSLATVISLALACPPQLKRCGTRTTVEIDTITPLKTPIVEG
jgi:hypothetical protein